MNTVCMDKFTLTETVVKIVLVFLLVLIRFLYAASGRGIVAGYSKTDHRAIRKVKRTLHKALTKGSPTYNQPTVPILYGARNDFGSRG